MMRKKARNSPHEIAARLRGAIGFPVTPFERDDVLRIDWDAFRTHVDFLAGAGLSALVVAGGTGEAYSLRPSEITQLAREAVSVVGGRAAVAVGVGFGIAQACDLSVAVREVGADAVLALPPYYPTPDRDALVDYYQQIARSVPDLAVVPYSRGAATIDPELLAQLVEEENIVAFKDGQGDVRMFQRNRSALGERLTWLAGSGDDLVGAYAAAGADGFTSSVACYDPALSIELWRLASTRQFGLLRDLCDRMIQPWYELRSRRPGYEVAVVKGAMEAFGSYAGSVRPPLAPLTLADQRLVERMADEIGKFTSRPVAKSS